MKIACSPYLLKGKPPFRDREGALLQFKFDDGVTGYADCHPWDVMGDLPLKEQLKLIKSGKFTSLTERSLAFARRDGVARKVGLNLFEGLSIPPSHWLLTDKMPTGFSRVKVKHVDFDNVLQQLPENMKVRLDFNERLTEKEFIAFLTKHQNDLHHIEFIEDPFPFDAAKWTAIQQKFPVALACDRHVTKAGDPFIAVIKPAAQKILYRRRIVITSYLDHPLGQLAAAYTAAIYRNRVGTCGLLSHHAYETNPFSEQLSNNGPLLIPPKEGTGFGFDTLLKKCSWESL